MNPDPAIYHYALEQSRSTLCGLPRNPRDILGRRRREDSPLVVEVGGSVPDGGRLCEYCSAAFVHGSRQQREGVSSQPRTGGSDRRISVLVGLLVVIVAAAVIALLFFLQPEEAERPVELATLVETPTATPTRAAVSSPTALPTSPPTVLPTAEPTLVDPTFDPESSTPTVLPSPTALPTAEPTSVAPPTPTPTPLPLPTPTATPTPTPTPGPVDVREIDFSQASRILLCVAQYTRKQVKYGEPVSFVIEPALDRCTQRSVYEQELTENRVAGLDACIREHERGRSWIVRDGKHFVTSLRFHEPNFLVVHCVQQVLEPVEYVIEALATEMVGSSDELVSVAVSITVRNSGGDGESEQVPVEVSIDGERPSTVHQVGGASRGDIIPISFTTELTPGPHTVRATVGNSSRLIEVDVGGADIIVEPLGHVVTGGGSIELQLRVTNEGLLTAEGVTASASWASNSGDADEASSGNTETFVPVEALGPGQSRQVGIDLEIPTGSYNVTVSVDTESLELSTEDNTVQTTVEVDYVQLLPALESVHVAGYGRDGAGMVEIALLVRNEGTAPSGPTTVGISCAEDSGSECYRELDVASIEPGETMSLVAPLSLPQGRTRLVLFAGGLEDGYRWGAGNVTDITVDVPARQAVDLDLEADANVSGYWSDGTANVELALALRNDGYLEFGDSRPVTASCVLDGQAVAGCGGELDLSLPDGFGPGPQESIIMRLPAGTVTLQLDYGEKEQTLLDVRVPERIVGMKREVWDCYVDRRLDSDRANVSGDRDFYGCSGWDAQDSVQRVRADSSIVVWATGDDRYIEILRESIDELSPILNLNVQWSDLESQATLKAYVGIPRGEWRDYGLTDVDQGLLNAAGFARSTKGFSGEVIPEEVVVWRTDREWTEAVPAVAKSITIHELLHALTGVDHVSSRTASMMGYDSSLPKLSPMDEALFRLNSHPLLEAGMTLSKVADLLVYEEDLLDASPSELDVVDMLWRAATQLVDAGAVRFHLRGGWIGDCNQPFGTAAVPAILDISGFRGFLLSGVSVARYQDSSNTYWITWSEEDSQWHYFIEREGLMERVTWDVLDEAVSWHVWTDKLSRTLYTLISDWNEENVQIIREGGALTFRVTLDESHETMWVWEHGQSLDFTLTVDAETYEIESYIWKYMYSPRSGFCDTYEEIAQTIELGVDLTVPSVVAVNAGEQP